MSSFKIATYAEGVVGLTALDALTEPVTPDPQFYFEPYSTFLQLGDGSVRGQGSPKARWRFPQLTLEQRNQLAAYCTAASSEVYIQTPVNDGTFKVFLAVMRLPETEPANKAGFLRDFDVSFSQMVEQESE